MKSLWAQYMLLVATEDEEADARELGYVLCDQDGNVIPEPEREARLHRAFLYAEAHHYEALRRPGRPYDRPIVRAGKSFWSALTIATNCTLATVDATITAVEEFEISERTVAEDAVTYAEPRRHAMGLFEVDVDLEGPRGERERLSMLVDTSATYSVVPPAIAERLRLRILREETFQVAGGARLTRQFAEVRMRVNDREGPTVAIVMDGPTLLGAHALDGLGLSVDPQQKHLIPVEPFIGALPVTNTHSTFTSVSNTSQMLNRAPTHWDTFKDFSRQDHNGVLVAGALRPSY